MKTRLLKFFFIFFILFLGCENAEMLVIEQGMKYLESGNYDKAIDFFSRCVNREGEEGYLASTCSFFLGKAYYEKGQYKEAINHMERADFVLKKDLANKRKMAFMHAVDGTMDYWIGMAYYNNNQYKEAIHRFTQALEKAVVNPQENFKRDWAKWVNIPNVRFWMNYFMPLFPPKYACYFRLGSAYYFDQQYEQAVLSLQKAIELDPNSPDSYMALAASYRELKRYNEAIAAINKSIEIKPNEFSYGILSSVYFRQGKIKEAIEAGKRALELNTKNIRHYYHLSDLYLKIEDYQNSIALLKKAQEIEPNKYDIPFSLGYKYAMLGNFDDAIATINKAVELSMSKPYSAGPLGLRSIIYSLKGNFEKANEDAKLAYSLDPDNKNAKMAIAFSYIIKSFPNKKDSEIKNAIDILSSIKDDNLARILEALAYSKNGDLRKSAEIYSSIPEEYFLTKNAIREQFKEALLEALVPYVENKKENIKILEAKGQYRDALEEYKDLLKILDENGKKMIRNNVSAILKKNPHLTELPEDARKHALIAEIMTKEGRFEDSVIEYKKALKIAPFYPQLYKAISLNYAEMKEYKKAIENMIIYLDLFPEAPDARPARDEIYKWEFMLERRNK